MESTKIGNWHQWRAYSKKIHEDAIEFLSDYRRENLDGDKAPANAIGRIMAAIMDMDLAEQEIAVTAKFRINGNVRLVSMTSPPYLDDDIKYRLVEHFAAGLGLKIDLTD